MIERASEEDLGSLPFEVIDSLVSTEVAATSTIAAVPGIATRAYVAAGQVSVLASDGFIEHAL